MIMIMIMNLLVTCGLSKRCSPLVITVFVMIVIIVNDNDNEPPGDLRPLQEMLTTSHYCLCYDSNNCK